MESMVLSLTERARMIRCLIIEMLATAQSGHSAGALGMSDVFATLYFSILRHDPQNPDWEERDYLLLSNGHICPVLYATLAHAGYFPENELQTLRTFGSRLQGHPHLGSLPGVENTSGPLAQGLSQACGLAWSLKLDTKNNRVYCVMSDGELEEGQNWEAFQSAAKFNLHNLTVLIDRNNIQIDGYTHEVMPLEPLADKLISFGWRVLTIDGHSMRAIHDAVFIAKHVTTQPTAIICKTVPGRGVSFMENLPEWHGKPPSAEQAIQALRELRGTA